MSGNLVDILTPHHTDARIYRTYDDALSAATGLGITASPQRCLAKEGWAVVVVHDGGQWYYAKQGR